MSLSEIKNRLYKKDEKPHLAEYEKSEFDPESKTATPSNIGLNANDAWEEKKAFIGKEEKKAAKVGFIWLGVILGIIGIVVGVFQVRKSSFNESKIAVSISGPDEVRSGELATYEVSYVNDNWGSLENVVLRISHPESFNPEDSEAYKRESPTVSSVEIGDIKGHSSGKIIFSGKAYSPKGTLIYIKADMDYMPGNFNSKYSTSKQMGINVTSTPIRLEVMAPLAAASGNAIDYEIRYKNEGAEDFDDLRIRVDYPEGFAFSGSDPGISEGNNTWHIGTLKAGEAGKIIINGSIQGDKDTYKSVEAFLGSMSQGNLVVYDDEKASTKIIASPLSIWQIVNENPSLTVNPGDGLRFKIFYKNDGELRLQNVIIRENIDSLVLDYSTLKTDGGAFDDSSKTIEWKASDHPKLALVNPGDEGYVEFSIKVKDIIPVKTVDDNNFMISSVAKIDSPDIPTPINMNKIVLSNRKDMKLNTKLILGVQGLYKSPTIENFGPIPPKVGEETSYTIHLKAGNVSNKVTDAKVEIVLPTWVTMTGKKNPENADLDYNERTNSLVWRIGDMQVGEGIVSPYRELAFQIKIKPSPNQAGDVVQLVKSMILSGKDLFTGLDIVTNGGAKNTMLLEDAFIKSGGKWDVIE